MKLLHTAILVVLTLPTNAWASSIASDNALIDGLLLTILYGAVGIAMATVGYKVVDALTPGALGKDIAENKNTALAILAGSMILGICFIIGCAIVG